jgi:Choline-binding repeat/Putative cell wall binding repeat
MKKIFLICSVAFLFLTVQATQTTAAGWTNTNGQWSYQTNSGNLYKGWLRTGDSWYFLSDKGVMKTGWIYDGAWYYLKSNGKMAMGWVYDGAWYYLNGSGAMQTGWSKVGNTWYYLEHSGKMKTGWLKDGGNWYYLQSSGSMKTGWLKEDTSWYYLASSGKMLSGWKEINNKTYYFYPNGKMAANTTVDGKQLGADGTLDGMRDALELSWSSGKVINNSNIDFGQNGYKGINSYSKFTLLNSANQKLYTYESPYFERAKIHSDGTVYLLETTGDDHFNLVSLNQSGKVNWKESLKDYSDIQFNNIQDNGILSLTVFSIEDDHWYALKINPENGEVLSSTPTQGKIYGGQNDKEILPYGNNLENFKYIASGNTLWDRPTPDRSAQIENVEFSSIENVAVQSAVGDIYEYVQLFNSQGKELLSKTIEAPDGLYQIEFNEEGQLLITTSKEGYLLNEWYDKDGQKIDENTVFYEGYVEQYNSICKVDTLRNIWVYQKVSDSVVIGKYDKNGKLVGKTTIPKEYRDVSKQDKSGGLVFEKYDTDNYNNITLLFYRYK